MTQPYLDAQNQTLINLLGIQDADELRTAEYAITDGRLESLTTGHYIPHTQKFNFERLREIHRFLFKDIYPWAGKIRALPYRKPLEGDLVGVFVDPAEILPGWRRLEKRIADFTAQDKMPFPERVKTLADIMIEANHLHPFPEGNGRSLQIFMQQLAQRCGVRLDYGRVQPQKWNFASAVSAVYGHYWQDADGTAFIDKLEPDREPMRVIFRTMASEID